MTLLVNGVPLDDEVKGWALQGGTNPLLSVRMEHTVARMPGRDGVVFSGGVHGAGEMRFKVKLSRGNREDLFSVFRAPTLTVTSTEHPGLTAVGVLRGSSMENHYDFLDFDEELFVVEVADGAWRGTQVTSPLVSASALGADLTVFSGLSAPVQDAAIRLKGPLEDPQVTDTAGSFFVLDGSIPAGQYVRFEADTGRAWLTTTDVWSGGTEVSGQVDFGGPRDVFEITPHMASPSAPGTRVGKLTLSQQSFNSGSGFQVRGRSAHLM